MIRYENMMPGQGKASFAVRYALNVARTWWNFHVRWPWVEYRGFVRVRHHTRFYKGMTVSLGDCVQFGPYNEIACDLQVGDHVLFGSSVLFAGRHDHTFRTPGVTIWSGPRGENAPIVVENDVWVGSGSILLSGIRIGKGAVIAAGSVVTKDIPPCEIWGGNPARKIGDRFETEAQKQEHLSRV